MKKYFKNIPKSIPHFLGVGDDYNYEKKIQLTKKIILECSAHHY
jgi:hypothetical protein